MRKLLIVDDEPRILSSLRRLFFQDHFEVEVASSGEEALIILKTKRFDMIISDMRMPEMDGLQLLKKAKALYPEMIRVMISGYTEEEQVVEALKNNLARVFLFKPWENDKLLRVINEVFDEEERLRQKQIFKLINSLDDLPTIQSSYRKICEMISNEEDIKIIAREIGRDQSIATRILHIANSALYSAKIGSIQQAVSIIGLRSTKNIVLSASILDSFTPSGVLRDEIENLWNHSFQTSRLLSAIYTDIYRKKMPDEYCAAGLLQNIGIVFFLKFFPQEFHEVLDLQIKDHESFRKWQREKFNTTTSELGAYLLKWWELPEPIVQSAAYCFYPQEAAPVYLELVKGVHLAARHSAERLQLKEPFYVYTAYHSEYDQEIQNLSSGIIQKEGE